MTNQEYLEQHPTQFKDDIDKWLFTEFSIIGGCSSAQGSIEYSVARMVAEKMKQKMIDKAVEWLYNNYSLGCEGMKNFRKAMEE